MKECESSKKSNSLNELLVSGFDNEQIWQQLELQNSQLLSTSRLCADQSLKNKGFTFLDSSVALNSNLGNSAADDDDDEVDDDGTEEEDEPVEDNDISDPLEGRDEDEDDNDDEEDEEEEDGSDEANPQKIVA